jgi:methionine synthase I (cobalamin-dependent)
MFNNQYLYNQQPNIDRINAQINELENMKKQIQQPVQPTNLTQNFQISPTNREVIKYANSMDDVQKEYIVGDTPYFSKDLSVVWIKSTNGNIKTYELTEIVPKDEKDIKIEYLQAQIEELKKGILNNESNANIIESITDTDKSKKSTSVSTVSKSNKKSE